MRYSRLICGLLACLLAAACTPAVDSKSAKKAKYHYYLGISHIEENEPSAALKELLEAEKIDDDIPEVQAALAQAYMMKGAYPQAEQHYLQAYELTGDTKYKNNLGAIYLSAERYDDAIEAFREAANDLLFSNPEISWTGMGVAFFKKQDYAAAEQAYLKARAANERYPNAPYRLGELYYAQERPVEAVDAFNKAVELSPNFVDAHYRLALAYMKTRQNGEARASFQRVISLAPQSEQARLSAKYLAILEP